MSQDHTDLCRHNADLVCMLAWVSSPGTVSPDHLSRTWLKLLMPLLVPWLQSQISCPKPVLLRSINIRGEHSTVARCLKQSSFHIQQPSSLPPRNRRINSSSRWKEWRRGSAAHTFPRVRDSSCNIFLKVLSMQYIEFCCFCANHTVIASSPASSGWGIWFSREEQLRKASNRIWLAN